MNFLEGEVRMSRRVQRLVLAGGIILSAIIVAAVMITVLGHQPPTRDRVSLDLLVDVMQLETMSTRFHIDSQGTVRPRTETVLSAEISGTIVEISPKFVAGGVFRNGETLIRIDPTDYRVDVNKAEALVRQRQIEHVGAKKLLSKGYRAESEFASAEAALASAEAELVRARRNLERTRIRLPYDGMVRAKETDLGQFVSPGTRLGVVFATEFAEVRLPLTDQDLAFVDLPDAADITESGEADGPVVTLSAVQHGRLTEWSARIVRSEGIVDEKSRVTFAVARIKDPYQLHGDDKPLPIGTFVAASIEGTTVRNVIRVPRTSLRGSDQLLFVNSDNKLEIRVVDIVRADADFAYVQGGASPGERIIVTAIEAPINGMSIRTTDDPAPRDGDADEQIASEVGEELR